MTDFTTIKRLFNIVQPCGFDDDEIDIIKNIFGRLPTVLIDYYSELGKDERLNHTQDSLVRPDEFKYFKDSEYLIFYCENQCVCYWGIHKDDLTKPNPPVYISYDQKAWEKETDELLDFLIAMAYLQAVFGLEFSIEEFYSITKQDVENIGNNFKSKPVQFSEWLGVKFYANHDDSVIAVINNGDDFDLIYSSGSKEHFDEMDTVLSKLGIND